KALEQAVRIAPHFPLAHAGLAEAWNELDMTERASQEMLLARRVDISSLAVEDKLQMEAIDLTITREFDAAVGKYEQARKLVRGLTLDVDLGRAYERAGQPAKALENYRHAAESLNSPAAWLRLAVLYSRSAEVGDS